MCDEFRINNKTQKKRNDTSVQGTNDSSVLSKISTCQAGYFDDNYLQYFANKLAKRSSLVNRGYYIRAKLIDFVLDEFIKKCTKKQNQFFNLGAGFDATFFRLKHQKRLFNTLFIEIDFPDVIKRKYNLIKGNENLLSLCPGLQVIREHNENIVYSCKDSRYVMIGVDMRNTVLLDSFLKIVDGFSDTDMTFLLSEVVLTYMAVNSCNGVINWVTETFQNCILTVYEQINPFDPFGQVMCSHFKKLGSPLKCIARYPYENDQRERYRAAGFTDSFAMKASDFYGQKISREEKLRIEKLELFDEYEPWHLKCSHYTVIAATCGEFLSKMAADLYETVNSVPDMVKAKQDLRFIEPLDSCLVQVKSYVKFDLKFGIRYGHTMIATDRHLFVIGGFGENVTEVSGKHMRHNTIEVLDLNTFDVSVIDSIRNVDRIFHTCNLWPSKDSNQLSLLLTYGRSNPSKLFETTTHIKIPYAEQCQMNANTTQEVIFTASETQFPARFRHATCLTSDNSRLFVHGGKYFDEACGSACIYSDAYLIDADFNIEKLDVDESICAARHSHSISAWKHYLVISGGLDQNENPLDDVILFNCHTLQFSKVVLPHGQIFPRYAHTSHVIEDTLILVGGCNYSNSPPGVCFLDLNDFSVREFNIPYRTENMEPLMLIQHQSHVIDKNNILVVGGGAICFTFGTHLNRQPFLLDLQNCWSQFYPA